MTSSVLACTVEKSLLAAHSFWAQSEVRVHAIVEFEKCVRPSWYIMVPAVKLAEHAPVQKIIEMPTSWTK